LKSAVEKQAVEERGGSEMLSEDAEVCERLNRLARLMGRVMGIEIGVDESGDRLIFVDADDEAITNEGQEIIAATRQEIVDKTFLDEFPVRALRAAVLAKFLEIERSRTP
jgi:hypothetical protein